MNRRKKKFFLDLPSPLFSGFSVGGQDFTGFILETEREQGRCVYRLAVVWLGG